MSYRIPVIAGDLVRPFLGLFTSLAENTIAIRLIDIILQTPGMDRGTLNRYFQWCRRSSEYLAQIEAHRTDIRPGSAVHEP
jgi:hypothetical protein